MKRVKTDEKWVVKTEKDEAVADEVAKENSYFGDTDASEEEAVVYQYFAGVGSDDEHSPVDPRVGQYLRANMQPTTSSWRSQRHAKRKFQAIHVYNK